MINCHSCNGEIQQKAIKCKHCKRWIANWGRINLYRLAAVLLVSGLAVVFFSISHSRKVKATEARVRHEKAVLAASKAEQDRLTSLESKLSEEYEKFRKDTNDTLQEITRLEAATETGINLRHYSELLANVNYKVRTYREQYSETVQSRLPVYTATLAAMAAYADAADSWRSKNSSYSYSSIASEYEDLMQKAWRLGTEELKKARKSAKTAPGLEPWRQPDIFQAYLNQVLPAKPDVEFVLAHQAQINKRSLADSKICQANCAEIQYALELWSSQHDGRYPDQVGGLVPKYLEAVPPCPSGAVYSYDSTGEKGPPDICILDCENHPRPTPPALQAMLKQLEDSK